MTRQQPTQRNGTDGPPRDKHPVPMISSHMFRNSVKRRGASFRMRFNVFCTACSMRSPKHDTRSVRR
jgi:hypothetical protein